MGEVGRLKSFRFSCRVNSSHETPSGIWVLHILIDSWILYIPVGSWVPHILVGSWIPHVLVTSLSISRTITSRGDPKKPYDKNCNCSGGRSAQEVMRGRSEVACCAEVDLEKRERWME